MVSKLKKDSKVIILKFSNGDYCLFERNLFIDNAVADISKCILRIEENDTIEELNSSKDNEIKLLFTSYEGYNNYKVSILEYDLSNTSKGPITDKYVYSRCVPKKLTENFYQYFSRYNNLLSILDVKENEEHSLELIIQEFFSKINIDKEKIKFSFLRVDEEILLNIFCLRIDILYIDTLYFLFDLSSEFEVFNIFYSKNHLDEELILNDEIGYLIDINNFYDSLKNHPILDEIKTANEQALNPEKIIEPKIKGRILKYLICNKNNK